MVLSIGIVGLETFGWLRSSKPSSALEESWRFNHTWRPNSSSIHREWIALNPEFPAPYKHTYNQQGWIASYDIDPAKPDCTFRIFYVGDSMVEGTAPMATSVPSRVERRLNALAEETDLRFEVINTGTSSYSPLIYYVLIRYKIMDYDPDLIVVNVDMTDEYDDWKYRQTAIFDEDGNPVAVPPRNAYLSQYVETTQGTIPASPLSRVQLFLYRNSYFYNYLLDKIATGRTPTPVPSTDDARSRAGIHQRYAWCTTRDWDASTVENVNSMLDVLRRIAQFCQERGVKLMLTSVPHYPQYAGSPDGKAPPAWSARPHREVSRLAAELQIPYLDSFEALAPLIRGTPHQRYYYRRDVHFNPVGYHVWANAHLAFLTDPANQLVPDACVR